MTSITTVCEASLVRNNKHKYAVGLQISHLVAHVVALDKMTAGSDISSFDSEAFVSPSFPSVVLSGTCV